VDRAVADGRLPPPKYPFANKIPYWDGDDLDAHDRDLTSPNRPPAQLRHAEVGTTVATAATT